MMTRDNITHKHVQKSGNLFRALDEAPAYGRGSEPGTSELPTWSGTGPLPARGERVNARGLGDGIVRGYFTEHGYVGVRVLLVTPPAWYVKQNGRHCLATMFGAELTPAAACLRCGGWTSVGGMSQHSKSIVPVLGRTGCTCLAENARHAVAVAPPSTSPVRVSVRVSEREKRRVECPCRLHRRRDARAW